METATKPCDRNTRNHGPLRANGQKRREHLHKEEANAAPSDIASETGDHLDCAIFPTMPDDQLMQLTALRKPEALEAIYTRYLRSCYGVALRIVLDPCTAEEIVQDVFLKLWISPAAYAPGRGKFLSWLLTLVRNRSIDQVRWAKLGNRGKWVPLDRESGSGMAVTDTMLDTSPGPYEEAWRHEMGNAIRQALDLLSASQRETISLAYFSGLTQKQISERLGVPMGTIKTRTRCGLFQLRTLLAQRGILRGSVATTGEVC
jgi:RNA polymerase sigma-70 factor (ECF subfamily)